MEDQEVFRDRLHITQEDLAQASRFGRLILSLDSDTEKEDQNSRLIRQALDIALVVSYCRPFTLFRSKEGKRESRLPESLLAVLSNEERSIHESLLNQRNQEYAHSDASQIEVRYYSWPLGILPISRNRFVPMPRPTVEQVVIMSDKLYLKLVEELNILEASHTEAEEPQNPADRGDG
jgi:hypothetical protein